MTVCEKKCDTQIAGSELIIFQMFRIFQASTITLKKGHKEIFC